MTALTPPAVPEQPEVSVVLPTHDVAPWLRECLSSLLDDQDVALEVIAVDDASTDDTWQILTETAERDPRLRVVRNPGAGGAEARNHGATLARAPYLAFCDSDDLVPRGAYRAMLASAQANGADMVVGSFLKFFVNRTWRPTAAWPAFDAARTGITLLDEPSLLRNRACWNRLFRTDFWRASGIEFPTVPRSNDVVPMTRALCRAGSVNVVTDTVYLYRSRPGMGSMSARAHGADSVVSYLEQERASLQITREVGDAELTSTHESLYLDADGWVHLRNFLRGPGFALCTADELDRVRAALAGVGAVLTPGAVERAAWNRRWLFTLALAEQWDDARRLAGAIDGEHDHLWSVDLLTRLVDRDDVDPDALRALAEGLVLRPLTTRRESGIEALPALLRGREVLGRIFPDPAAPTRSAAQQHLLQAVARGDEETLARLLEDLPLRFRLRRITGETAGAMARVLHVGPRGGALELYLRQGATSRPLTAVDLSWDAEPMLATLPPTLRRGDWELRVRAGIGGFAVDAPVVLAKTAPERADLRGRPLVLTRADLPGGPGTVITVGDGTVRRLAGRVRRRLGLESAPPGAEADTGS